MRDLHKITVRNTSLSGSTAQVTLDGRPLHGLTRLELSMGADEITRVTLELVVDGVNADVEAEVDR